MKLDNKTHVVVYDLMECYKAVTAERVRNSLLVAMNQVLAAALDPEVHYRHTGVKIDGPNLQMFMFPNDDEDAPAEMVHTIDMQTGAYTTTGSPK